VLGSFTPFDNAALICETYNSDWGYSYARCNDISAMAASQGPTNFQYFQPIGYFRTHSGENCPLSGCPCNSANSFLNLQGFLKGTDNHIKPVVNLWTGGRNNPQQASNSFYNVFICGYQDFPKVSSSGFQPLAPIVSTTNGSVHTFDNRRSTTDLTIDLSQTIETSSVRTTQLDSSSTTTNSKSFGWSTEISASSSAEYMGVGVEFSATQSFSGNEDVSEEISKSSSDSTADSVTITNSLSGEIIVPAGTRVRVTEIITATVVHGTIPFVLDDGVTTPTSEALGLMSTATATTGYYVEQF